VLQVCCATARLRFLPPAEAYRHLLSVTSHTGLKYQGQCCCKTVPRFAMARTPTPVTMLSGFLGAGTYFACSKRLCVHANPISCAVVACFSFSVCVCGLCWQACCCMCTNAVVTVSENTCRPPLPIMLPMAGSKHDHFKFLKLRDDDLV
jgi:hypothetical protein